MTVSIELPPRTRIPPGMLSSLVYLWLVFITLYLIGLNRFHLMSIIGVIPPILFLVIPIAVSALLILTRASLRLLLLSVVGVALGATQVDIVMKKLDFDHYDPLGDVPVKIVNWNTAMWDDYKDPDAFFEYLISLDADVYVLQERLYDASTEKHLLAPDKYSAPHPITGVVTGFPDLYISIEDNSDLKRLFPAHHFAAHQQFLVLSKYPIEQANLDPSDQFQVVDIRVGERVLRLFNVHIVMQFENFNPFSGSFYTGAKIKNSAREIGFANLNEWIANTETFYLVAGDFNTASNMGLMNRLRESHVDLFRYGVERIPKTFRILGLRLWRIDWLFIKKGSGLKILNFANEERGALSDHSAQTTLLGVPQGTRNDLMRVE